MIHVQYAASGCSTCSYNALSATLFCSCSASIDSSVGSSAAEEQLQWPVSPSQLFIAP